MLDFYIDLGISVIITLLRSLTSPPKKAKFKAVFLKINKLIQGVYGSDTDFVTTWCD